MATDLDYTTGTISVTAGASVIVGVGTAWSSVAEKYDIIVPTGVGNVAVVKTVTDDTHIVPFGGWQGGTLAGVTYTLIKNSVNRFANAEAMQVVIDTWEMLQSTGVIYAVVGAGVLPDVSIGTNGQYAINLDDSPWSFYKKVAGVWTFISSILPGTPAGTIRTPAFATTIPILTTDREVGIDTSGGAVNATLPTATAWAAANLNGLELALVDWTGNADVNNITPVASGAEIFKGGLTPKVTSAFGLIKLRPIPGVGWYLRQ